MAKTRNRTRAAAPPAPPPRQPPAPEVETPRPPRIAPSPPIPREIQAPVAAVPSTDWIYGQPVSLGPLERVLLLAVAAHVDDDGWFRGCLEELASWTGLDPSAAEHVRLGLISRGLLAYSDSPEDAPPPRDCSSQWCTPEARAEHPQRVRLVEPGTG